MLPLYAYGLKRLYFLILPFTKLIFPLILFLFFIGTNSLIGQYKYRGKVLNEITNKSVIGATINIPEEDDFTFTNILGRFEYESESSDSLLIVIDKKKYQPVERVIYPQKNIEVKLLPNNEKNKAIKIIKAINPVANNYGNTFTVIRPNKIDLGLSQDAAILLQHQVPGLTVSRTGNDPNEYFKLYNRGVSSAIERNYPLVIIDGVPEMSMERIMPDDIATIAVSKSAVGGAKYGVMGGAGVIEIVTKRFSSNTPKLSYHTNLGFSIIQNTLPILSSEEYLEYKPFGDRGASTDWIEAVTRTGISQRHHLAYSQAIDRGGIYASLGYDNNNGILKESGYHQGNARLNIQKAAKNENTIFTTTMAYTQRDANLSDNRAFWEATGKNPTIPVYDENGELTVEPGWETSVLNPLGLIVENTNLARTRDATVTFKADHYRSDANAWEYLFTYRNRRVLAAQTRQAFGTRLEYDDFHRNHLFASIKSNNRIEKKAYTISFQTGVESSILTEKNKRAYTYQFIDDITFNNLKHPKESLEVNDLEEFKLPKKIIAGFFNGDYTWNIFKLNAGIRYDRIFQNDDNAGIFFFHSQITTDFKSIIKNIKVNKATLALGYGKTGLPTTFKNRFFFLEDRRFNLLAGEYAPAQSLPSDFINEFKTEINLQIDLAFFDNRLKTTLDIYDNLLYNQVITPVFTAGDLGNKGIELFLSYSSKKEKKWRWIGDISFYYNKSSIYRYTNSGNPMTLAEAIFAPDFWEIWLEPYGPVGQLYLAKTDGTFIDGEYLQVDEDGDNVPDFVKKGNARPSVGISSTHTLKRNKWDATIRLRSQLGHHLINYHRYLYEQTGWGDYNILKTKYFNEQRTRIEGFFSDVFSESASFLKLDFLSIGFSPTLKKGSMRLYMTGLDLLTLTGYTGIDPEPDFERFGFSLGGGMDSSENHHRSRKFVLGVQYNIE